jgi:dienelactone hydrolase
VRSTAYGLGLLLVLGLGPTAAQDAPDANQSKLTFASADVLGVVRTTQQQCEALGDRAVWVTVGGEGECQRYYLSKRGAGRTEALVYLHDDVVTVNGRGEAKPQDSYLQLTPAALQTGSSAWGQQLRMAYLFLGRPGTFGSSGDHAKRRTQREIDLVSAALDAIKARHRYARLHLVASGEGGHTAAALLAKRTDLGCVVLASALLSVRARLAELGRSDDVTGDRNPIDPISLVDKIANRPDLRIFVLTDPDDSFISARSQGLYVKRLIAAGLPVRQIFAAASDPYAHVLASEARRVGAECIDGTATDAIVAKFENKKPTSPPDAAEPPMYTDGAVLRGVTVSEAQCRQLALAVWVKVDGRGFCVRYFMSTAGGNKDAALVFFNGDILSTRGGKPTLAPGATNLTAGGLERFARVWSRLYKGPYLEIGRLGTLGSTGNHLRDRRTLLEVRVAAAALDALKARYGFKRFNVVGQSGGGHTVMALAQMREDLGCVVAASGGISVKSAARDLGLNIGTKIASSYDPIEFVAGMHHRPGRRMIVMSDPDDKRVSYRSQREFVERVKAKGLAVLQVTAAAGDKDFHGLGAQAQRLAIDCANEVDDADLIARYQNKQPRVTPVSARKR